MVILWSVKQNSIQNFIWTKYTRQYKNISQLEIETLMLDLVFFCIKSNVIMVDIYLLTSQKYTYDFKELFQAHFRWACAFDPRSNKCTSGTQFPENLNFILFLTIRVTSGYGFQLICFVQASTAEEFQKHHFRFEWCLFSATSSFSLSFLTRW